MDKAFLFSLSVLIPAVIGLIRFRHVDDSYRIFIVFLWLGFIAEIANRLLIVTMKTNAPSWNIYNVLEFLILMTLFRKWQVWKGRERWYLPFLIFSLLIWIADVFIFGNIKQFNSYFGIYYCFIIVMFAITNLNKQITTEKGDIIRSPQFIICIGLTIFFTYRLFVEVSLMPVFSISRDFFQRVFDIQVYVNLLVNLIYAIAILCLPRKRIYINSF
ncbi:MAG: hypothetical protein C5B52_16575 [Bacteroidetes bacterium]|nr:MAG: hypothetical protein C5B52_16575 [Bacteroidota bacterium]